METLVLVDDDQNEQLLFKRSVAKRSSTLKVMAFDTSEDALDWLRTPGNREEVMFVVADVHLPRMTGLEFLKEMKKDERTDTLPVVMMSASANPEDVREALQYCACGFFRRPMNMADTYAVVDLIVQYWTSSEMGL